MDERRDNITINRAPIELEDQSGGSERRPDAQTGSHTENDRKSNQRDIIKEKYNAAHERIPGETDERAAREVPKA